MNGQVGPDRKCPLQLLPEHPMTVATTAEDETCTSNYNLSSSAYANWSNGSYNTSVITWLVNSSSITLTVMVRPGAGPRRKNRPW